MCQIFEFLCHSRLQPVEFFQHTAARLVHFFHNPLCHLGVEVILLIVEFFPRHALPDILHELEYMSIDFLPNLDTIVLRFFSHLFSSVIV